MTDWKLIEYFYSWRPYKAIAKLLEVKHGVKRRYIGTRFGWNLITVCCSVSWIRLQYRRLSLKRRTVVLQSIISCLLKVIDVINLVPLSPSTPNWKFTVPLTILIHQYFSGKGVLRNWIMIGEVLKNIKNLY